MFAVLMIIGKEAVASIPNIEPVTLLCAICSVLYGRRALAAVYVFVLVQGLLYGFHIWWIFYLYAWPICCLLAQVLRKYDKAWLCALLMGGFGLAFGALSAIPYLFIGGFQLAFTYWINGFYFDLIHCGGNFIICLVLYRPLMIAIKSALRKVPTNAYIK